MSTKTGQVARAVSSANLIFACLVVLIFYPADWSPVCGDELAPVNELMPEFKRHNAKLFGISVDGVWCHLAYAKDRHLRFNLLAESEIVLFARASGWRIEKGIIVLVQ